MPFDPNDVEALKRRRQVQPSCCNAADASEREEDVEQPELKRPAPGRTVQFNVRISVEDRAFLGGLAARRKMPVVEIVAEAIELLRKIHTHA